MHITHINSDHVFSIIKISIKVCIFSQIFKILKILKIIPVYSKALG